MDNKKEFLSTTEAAKYLCIERAWLYKLMQQHVIPYYKPGGKLCYLAKSDLDAYIAKSRIATQEENDDLANLFVKRK